MDKRTPILVDYVMAMPPEYAGCRVPHDLIRNAHRFVFDKAASRTMARVGRDMPDLIAEQMRFAVAPFEPTWIEIDGEEHYRTLTGQQPDFTADARIGYLISHNLVRCFALGFLDMDGQRPPRDRAGMAPLAYKLNTPWPEHDQRQFCAKWGLTAHLLDAAFWGSSAANPIVAEPGARYRSVLRHAHTPVVLPSSRGDLVVHKPDGIRRMLIDSAGELRMILAALLLLNRPARPPVYSAVQPGRGWIGNKHRPYLSHSVVTLDLSEGPVLRPVFEGQGVGTKKRHHAVRHHYAHHWGERARGCVHDWERHAEYPAAVESDPERHCRWTCKRCETLRWRRQAHSRGTAAEGLVLTSYEVVNSRAS